VLYVIGAAYWGGRRECGCLAKGSTLAVHVAQVEPPERVAALRESQGTHKALNESVTMLYMHLTS
jgi:hypothetical protein